MKKREKPPGSGRKALDEAGTVVTTIRLTGEQRAQFQRLGGAAWLRAMLQLLIDGKR